MQGLNLFVEKSLANEDVSFASSENEMHIIHVPVNYCIADGNWEKNQDKNTR